MDRLIESVHKYTCLWKMDSEEYKLNDLKEAAWREVTQECDFPDVKQARAAWKNLRDGHRQAISRKKSMTGQAASFKNPWKYEKRMEFLLPAMENRPSITNVESQYAHQLEHPYGNFAPPKKKTTLVSLMEKEQKRRADRSAERDAMRKQILLGASEDTPMDSAIDKFFISMLLTTNALPERLQLRVQRQVFSVVMEAKEEYLASQTSTLTETSATNPASL